MKWLLYMSLGVGAGVALTLLSQKAMKNSDWSFTSRKMIDSFYEKLEEAYDAVKRIDAEDIKKTILDKLDDIKQRFYEFDISEIKDNAKEVVDDFIFELKNILGQIESQLSNQWLRFKDQSA